MPEDWDFAVIGSGAGGAAVAARLVEGGARVLLAEQGGHAVPQTDAMSAVHRYYALGGLQASMGNCLLPIATGRAVGGTTKINSATSMRTPSALLARWQEDSAGGFDAAGFERHIDEAWRRLDVKTAPSDTMSVSTKKFFAGLDTLGIGGAKLLDRAEKGCAGTGRCCFVCPPNAKMSADKAFLEPILGRPGFELAPGHTLDAVDAPASGPVRLRLKTADGRTRRVAARRLVLSCGTLATPYFVRRFRLGGRSRAAGGNLSVHPAAKIFARFDDPVRGWKGVPQGGGVVDPGEPRIRYEGVYTPPEMAAVTMPLEGLRLKRWVDDYARVATFGFMIQDLSRGRVRHPIGPGFPAIRYDMCDYDVSLMLRGMRFVGRTFLAAGARSVLLPLNRPDNEFDSLAALDAADFSDARASQLQMMAFHPLGTCAMGTVVDADLRLQDNVYVADGSVVPESLGVNPQVTIYAFALRLAERLLHG